MEKEETMIPQINKILYATDLSKNSSYAFFYAVDMARRNNASIVMLHSIEPVHYKYFASEDKLHRINVELEKEKKQEVETELKEMKESLQRFCNRMETQIGPPCVGLVSKILVPTGHPVEEILKAADEEACDAIVLGTYGKGFLKQTFLGSVAASVLERSRKPVFIVPLPSEKTSIDWDEI